MGLLAVGLLVDMGPSRSFRLLAGVLVLVLAAGVGLLEVSIRKQGEAESRTLKAELARETARLEDLRRELQAFSYSVSHDLRSPIRAISGYVASVDNAPDLPLSDQTRMDLERIHGACRRMAQMIDDLTGLAGITLGEVNRQPIDLGAIVEGIVSDLKRGQPTRAVELRIAPNLRVDADEHLVRIALGHLVNNAWKFTGKRPNARIEIGVESVDGSAAYYVRDNGAGFDATQAATRLFAPFQRFHGVKEFEGRGIGLAIAERSIRRHGGRMWARSEPEKGATFYFTLPAQDHTDGTQGKSAKSGPPG
jgi:light-regulated signal transduction histidine kinase (bacteriophytochrome)